MTSGVPLEAVVFDMDGVLIDTEPVWRRVEIAVFGGLGQTLTEEDCRETMGVRIDEVVRQRYERHPWTGPPLATVSARIVQGVIDHVSAQGAGIDGAQAAIAAVRAAGLRVAVASSSPRSLIAAVVDRLAIAASVDVICSAEQEAHGKPAPDVYLRAAQMLQVAPARCLAVEDSVNGVLAARAAGMVCVAIPDAVTSTDPRLAASERLSSIRELDAATLVRLRATYFA